MLDITKATVIHTWPYERPLLACRFDPQGRYVLTSAENNLLQRFSMADGTVTPLPPQHESWCQAIALSPDGNIAISGGGEGRLFWWDMQSNTPTSIRSVEAHTEYIRSICINATGNLLVSGGYDRAVHLWDTATGERIRSWTKHEINVYCVQFLSDSRRFLSGDLKGLIYLWDIEQEQPLCQWDASALHSYNAGQRVNFGGVRALAVSRDQKQMAAGGLHKATNPLGAVHEPLVLRFTMEDQQLLKTHTAEGITGGVVWRLVTLEDGTLCGLTGGSSGGFLLFWNDQQDLTTHKFQLPSLARDMDISANGRLIATVHHDRHLRITRLGEDV